MQFFYLAYSWILSKHSEWKKKAQKNRDVLTKIRIYQLLTILDYQNLYYINAKPKHSYPYGPICKQPHSDTYEYEWKYLKW